VTPPGAPGGKNVAGGEAGLLPLLRRLGIGFAPISPFGHGFLTGQIRTAGDIPDDRSTTARHTGPLPAISDLDASNTAAHGRIPGAAMLRER
jgi:aryl-alcohol dehydrogenase-like predicted oxidoreductase